MTESKFSAKGLSIQISVPLIQGNDVIGNLSDAVNSYSHIIAAKGGYLSADFNIAGNNEFFENWFQYGLGRHIQVFGPSMQVIFEGYTNQIDINMGGAKFTRGPLSNLANRVSAMYTPILVDPDTGLPYNPQITGTTTETVIAEDGFSQEKYGIWEKVLNISEATDVDAAYIRDLYLSEYSSPEGNPSLTIGESEGEISARIQCRGYIDWIENYIYTYDNGTESAISLWASDKLIDILEVDPNGVISTLYDKIDFNGVLVYDNELENKTAKTIIDDMLNLGDGLNNRWDFGIYAGRKAVYSSIPSAVEYLYYKTGRTQRVETMTGGIIEPWDVLPCKWVAIPSFLTGLGIQVDNPQNDPRVFFGEEVNFTAPDQVTISGAKVRKISQYLARLGLRGI